MSEIQLGAIALLGLGIFFRGTALGQKLYWYDEAFTSLRISGYSEADVMQQAFHGEEITPQELLKFQHPNAEKGLWGTVQGLAQEEPQHPPLYYTVVRLWAQTVGSSAATVRSLSVIFSLLVFPCLYWLCLELFGSTDVAWLAIALVAVSPLHVVFAQEARQYSLWTALILAASAALLYALRVDTFASWAIYAVTLSLGLYTFLFSGLVAIGHGIYVIGVEQFRWTTVLAHYLIASTVGLIAFLPWIWAIATRRSSLQTTTAWSTRPSSWKAIVRVWALNLRRIFFDADFKLDSQLAYRVSIAGVYAFVMSLEIGAIYWLWQFTALRVWLFVFTLIGTTAFTILLPDLLLGGQRSTATRYAIPCYLGIQIAIAFCLVNLLSNAFGSWQSILGWVALAGAIALSILSCSIGARTPIGWNKVISYYNPPIADIINQSPHPLLIANTSMGVGEILSLSRLLASNVTLQLLVDSSVPQIRAGFSDVFLMTYSQSWRSQIAAQQQALVQPAYQERGKTWLWQLIWQLNSQN
ncbi:MAG: hypothetical protein HC833_03495 [Leptolyngbyaceae cyanobacterium RM1_406_9]|nr:hypothetical protein [Leptolyngbyaceae cyanobacterium RM1_406_9]